MLISTRALLIVAICLLFEAPQEKETKTDMELLQGEWKIIEMEVDGKAYKPTTDIFLKFAKDTVEEWTTVEVACRSSFKIDPTKKPKTMDLVILENKLIPESKGTKTP